MTTDVPAEVPVTKPVPDVPAIEGLADAHALLAAAVPLPVSCEVPPEQTDIIPLMVGFGLTATESCAVVAHCPADGVKV